MISKEAIKEFLEKPRDSFDWIKEASRDELENSLKEICPTFQSKTKLFTHQLAATYLGVCFDGFLYFLDMGSGKSRISLTVVQIRKLLKKVRRTLILVPNLVNIESWLEEIKAATDLTAVGLIGTKDERLQLIQQKADLYILNYDGLPIFTTDFKETGKGARIKRKRIINQKALRSFATIFDMIVFDEIHHLKHTNTLTFQICRSLSDHAKYRIGMTGTPVGRDPQNFWSQFYICDHGETLGTNKTVFLQALFKQQAGYWGGVQWIFPEKNRPVLQKMLLHRSLRYADHECSDLPALSVIKVPLKLHPDASRVYRNLVLESIEQAKGNDKEAKNKRKNYYAKTRQVASGFLYDSDENESKVTLTFNNPKLDALEEILEDVPADSKVVIFHIFNQSGIDIGNKLKEMKIKYASMNVEAGNRKTEEYKKFKTDEKTKILVVNIASGGEGLNLQDANYCIIYEPTDRPDVHRQALKRTYRIGQTKHTYIYQFLMNNTVEKKIFEFLEEGKSLFSAVVEGSVSLKEVLIG